MKILKKILLITLPTVGVTWFMICFFSGCTVGLQPLADTVEMEAESAIDRGFDGIIVCVNRPGATELYAAGWHNRENEIPADPHSLFKIASISKLYIAAATAKLVHADRLSLDKTLAQYLPDIAPRIEHSDEITLRMLVQHRSGIPNFTDDSDFPWLDLPISNRDALEFVLDESADFQPDRRYKYSNTNYLLLGEILDSTLGYSHHQYIREEILEPLGLDNTYSLFSEVDPDQVMSGYGNYNGWEPNVKDNDYTIPGGSMVSTAEEVTIFLRALIDGTLFTPEEQEVYSSIYVYEHTGLLPGYQSIVRYHEGLDAVVVQFTSTSGKNSWSKSERVYRRIVRVLEKEE